MNIHWLQHVPFEGLGAIETWAKDHGHLLSVTRFHAGDSLPDPASCAMLVVMGGPMGINDELQYPWLHTEKVFLRQVIDAGTPVLGICLGAQLVANVLGARVVANKDKEIGWFPVVRNDAVPVALAGILPETQTVFHWHGDTFDLPEGATHLYSSAGCRQQAFIHGDRVIGLQFHLETTAGSAASLLEHCRHELVSGPWIQKTEDIAAGIQRHPGINRTLNAILDYLADFAR